MHVSCGAQTHAQLPAVDLKSTPQPLGQTDERHDIFSHCHAIVCCFAAFMALSWLRGLCPALLNSTCGLVAMTSASHAEGRQLDPGQVYVEVILDLLLQFAR